MKKTNSSKKAIKLKEEQANKIMKNKFNFFYKHYICMYKCCVDEI